MPVFNLHWLGRFGNCCFQYAFARAFCERNGLELRTDPWVGEVIFDIKHEPCVGNLPRKEEFSLQDGDANISYRSYSQQQKCVDYYSVADCRRWFRFSDHAKQVGDASWRRRTMQMGRKSSSPANFTASSGLNYRPIVPHGSATNPSPTF